LEPVQRRGGPQLAALLKRFGVPGVPEGAGIDANVSSVAEVPRLDNLCAGSAIVAAEASDRSMTQLFNPANSGITVIIHRLWVQMSAAGDVSLRLHDTELADTEANVSVISRRLGTQPAPSAHLRSLKGNSVGNTRVMNFSLDIADRTYEWDLSRLGNVWDFAGPSLAEGRGIVMVPVADNVLCAVNYLWSERITE